MTCFLLTTEWVFSLVCIYFLGKSVPQFACSYSFLSTGRHSLHLRVYNIFSCKLSDLNFSMIHFYPQQKKLRLKSSCVVCTKSCGWKEKGKVMILDFYSTVWFLPMMSLCQFIICTCWICLGASHAQFSPPYWNTLVQIASQENSPRFFLAEKSSMRGDLKSRALPFSSTMVQHLN